MGAQWRQIMDANIATFGPVIARLLLAALFLVNAVGMTAAFNNVANLMASKKVPIPRFLLGVTIMLWLIGGVCLVLGWNVRLAASALFLVMIPVTLVIHAPWSADSAQFENELSHFLKNVGILGGLLYVVSFGGGSYSFE
jgi:putative oxidoreductase